MNEILLFGMPNGAEWLVILVVVMLLFGGSRLPQLAKALGQSKRAFKEGIEESEEEARLEKKRESSASEPRSSLSAVDDEALFEEARRRARLRAAETNRLEDDKLLSEKPTADKGR